MTGTTRRKPGMNAYRENMLGRAVTSLMYAIRVYATASDREHAAMHVSKYVNRAIMAAHASRYEGAFALLRDTDYRKSIGIDRFTAVVPTEVLTEPTAEPPGGRREFFHPGFGSGQK